MWTKESSDAYKLKWSKRVAELACPERSLDDVGQQAADELLTKEEQVTYQEYKEQRFLDWVKTRRNG